MTEKDIKKSLSLKSHKSSGTKQSKLSVGSKNVTIQVKRKKIINPQDISKDAAVKSPVSDKKTLTNTNIRGKNQETLKPKQKIKEVREVKENKTNNETSNLNQTICA